MRIPEKGRPVACTVPTLRPRSRNDGSRRSIPEVNPSKSTADRSARGLSRGGRPLLGCAPGPSRPGQQPAEAAGDCGHQPGDVLIRGRRYAMEAHGAVRARGEHPSSPSTWKWTLSSKPLPNRCTTVTVPLRPSAMPARRARRRYQPSTARANTPSTGALRSRRAGFRGGFEAALTTYLIRRKRIFRVRSAGRILGGPRGHVRLGAGGSPALRGPRGVGAPAQRRDGECSGYGARMRSPPRLDSPTSRTASRTLACR